MSIILDGTRSDLRFLISFFAAGGIIKTLFISKIQQNLASFSGQTNRY